jgi:RTX calcium-binding nonapeptide repeat (4 copies)
MRPQIGSQASWLARKRPTLKLFVLAASLGALSLTASASPAGAAVTVGQTGPVAATCAAGVDWAQVNVSSGNSYVVPSLPPASALTITSWSHQAFTGMGRKLKLKVYRPVAGLTYTVVAQEARDLTESVLNTFPTSIAVQAGDVLGITTAADSTGTTGCGTGSFGETNYSAVGDNPDGAQVTFSTGVGWRLNVSAVVEPDCDQDGLGDETQDTNLSSCAPGTIPPPAPGTATATCKGKPATIVGTAGSDVRTASQGRDVIAGLGGNDTFSGLAGNDLICGGKGKDTLKGGKGKDTLLGQKGKDALKGGGGRDFCKGAKGNDTASGCEVEKSI